MVHDCKRLSLGFESSDDLLGVHSRFDNLQRNSSAKRRVLLCHVDGAKPTFADLLQSLYGPITAPGCS